MPILCICRGFQELNVAFGGTLHQHLHEIAGFADHRAGERKAALDEQYGPAHEVRVTPGGMFSQLLPNTTAWAPQHSWSIHSTVRGSTGWLPGFASKRRRRTALLKPLLWIASKAFLLGVQWHPEWRFGDNPVSRAIFRAFGAALRHKQPEP